MIAYHKFNIESCIKVFTRGYSLIHLTSESKCSTENFKNFNSLVIGHNKDWNWLNESVIESWFNLLRVITRFKIFLIIITIIICHWCKIWFLSMTIWLDLLSFVSQFFVTFRLKCSLNVDKLFFLLEFKHFGVDKLDSGLDVSNAGSSHGDGARREYFQGGFWIPDFIRDSGMKFWLVGCLLEGLREWNYFDRKWKSTGS